VSASHLIYGFHTVTSRLRQRAEGVEAVYVDAARTDARMRDLLELAQRMNLRVIQADGKRLDGMTGHARHQGVVAQVKETQPAGDLFGLIEGLKEHALLLVLDGVQDPHNLGACLRVADAFGVHAVVAPKDRAVGLTPTAAKVASGAAETVPYFQVTNLARTLRDIKEHGIWVIGADADVKESLFEAKLTGPLAWVLGAEGEGLRRLTREHCDFLARIPMAGRVASLNVSVASGVCLAETVRQRGLATP
jgi:23S rRNA (guanosine2251-2'-O)-methyltransferase